MKEPTKPQRRKPLPRALGADRASAFNLADVYAIKALAAGTAKEDQQQRAIAWIMLKAARGEHLSWVQGEPDTTTFNEGRRFVALEIDKLIKIDPDKMRESDAGRDPDRNN